MKKQCRTCRWFRVPPGKDRSKLYHEYNFICDWPIPAQPLPISITECYGFKVEPSRRPVRPTEGETCPTWEAWK